MDRVTRVCSALVAHDPVRALRDHVNELSLAFVAPLRADDHDGAGIIIEHVYFTGLGGGTWSTTRGGSSGPITLRIGRITVNVDPFPKTLSAKTCPPSPSTSFRVMLRPRPVPPNSLVRDWSTWRKSSQIPARSDSRIPIPVSRTSNRRSSSSFETVIQMPPV